MSNNHRELTGREKRSWKRYLPTHQLPTVSNVFDVTRYEALPFDDDETIR